MAGVQPREHSRRGLAMPTVLPQPGPCWSWLDVTKAAGSRKCPGPGWALAWQSLRHPARRFPAGVRPSLLLPWHPPRSSGSCGVGWWLVAPHSPAPASQAPLPLPPAWPRFLTLQA